MNAQKSKLPYRFIVIYLKLPKSRPNHQAAHYQSPTVPRDKQGPQPQTQPLFFPNLDPMLSILYLSGIEAAGPLLQFTDSLNSCSIK